MQSNYKKLESQIHDLQEQIKNLPNGELCCAANGKHYKWYLCGVHTNTYIPKSNRILAEQLAIKKYLRALSDDLCHEKRAIQFYLDHHNTFSKAEKILLHPEYQKLLATEFQPVSQDLTAWMNAPFEHNLNHPEHLVHRSSSGILPSIHLITTYETKENPLSVDTVEKIIKLYFLE